MNIPIFNYHPEPLKTGSIEESDNECECCGKTTGYIYTGPVYSEEELNDCICPWCIANGKAHEKFGAEFTDYDGISDYGSWEDASKEAKEEISFRTPGFCGWQQERWWTHCGDGCAYLGRAGKNEILEYGNDLIESLKNDSGLNGEDWETFLKALDPEDSPTAYVFKCLHCGKLEGYQDCD